jgi:hypothetical protein
MKQACFVRTDTGILDTPVPGSISLLPRVLIALSCNIAVRVLPLGHPLPLVTNRHGTCSARDAFSLIDTLDASISICMLSLAQLSDLVDLARR